MSSSKFLPSFAFQEKLVPPRVYVNNTKSYQDPQKIHWNKFCALEEQLIVVQEGDIPQPMTTIEH